MDIEAATPIMVWGNYEKNSLYIKRDDLLPYSFGGNKVRKAILFFNEIHHGEFDCVVTYGSSHSNHCRIVANMCAARKMKCYIISPEEVSDSTFNRKFMELFRAEIVSAPVKEVHDTIENMLDALRKQGKNPYFIPGGGHGNLGTQAYVNCYNEIKAYENEKNVHFDYIFFATGTGTTHSGLVCGQFINQDDRYIVGISIARKNPRGRNIVIDSIKSYICEKHIDVLDELINEKTIFVDDYIGNGYGIENAEVLNVIKDIMIQFGVAFDSTYTGKAFWGMKQYIKQKKIEEKNILFIHTGGTPLFFDDVKRL